jgi:uncharacterized protein YbgA (DUF1722 family)/uncharacterized protein YbbK (DUF523 family)
MVMTKILIGISECLLGEKVRFNGGHQHNHYITDSLGQYFEFMSYCPEVSIGMGIPREPIRLVGSPESPRAVGTKDASFDVTDKLNDYSNKTSKSLPEEMCGFILKSKSPTCGMERVKVYHNNGNPNAQSRGLFAKALLENNPTLPAEEEGRLADPALRENFIERVFLMRRWKDLMKEGINADKLIEFHAQHKLSLMAHHPMSYKELGGLLSDLKNKDIHALANDYFSRLMRGFTYKASRAKNTNVLQHCSGYLKNYLDKSDKEELQNIIQRYYQSEIPLIVPITLLSHYFRKYPNDYMSKQTFLKPYPNELSLRNSL